jgi:hypothetical protein|nr:MAG TPA: chemosensory protein [Caudoviricetes sp.]
MKYLYTIKEKTFTRDSTGDSETEKVLLKGTDQEKAVQKVDRIFRENKPEDFQMIVNEADEMAAEKYDEKTGYFEQYAVFIEVERLNF